MIKRLVIFGYRINFVLRHRFEKKDDLLHRFDWPSYELGIWFKKYKTVSKPRNGPAIMGGKSTLSNTYMIGLNLMLFKFWIDICYRPLVIDLKKNLNG